MELRNPLVLAIPRGGVETGAAIARELGAEVTVDGVRLKAPYTAKLTADRKFTIPFYLDKGLYTVRVTKDGVLVARHENEIGGTTDVAGRDEFADRRTTKTIDGREVTGWFTEDFTLAELRTLRAVERMPALRPMNTAYDGHFGIPTLGEVVALAARAGVGVYPETKHPTYFQQIGLPLERPLVGEDRSHPRLRFDRRGRYWNRARGACQAVG